MDGFDMYGLFGGLFLSLGSATCLSSTEVGTTFCTCHLAYILYFSDVDSWMESALIYVFTFSQLDYE